MSEPVVASVDLVVAGATMVATMDSDRREITDGWVAVRDAVVVAVGSGPEPTATRRLDATGCLVTPGLVNTHHHMWQNLTRSFRPMTSESFLGWLGALYPLWERLDEEAIAVSTRVAMAELALSGCTTSSDHLYLQPATATSFFDAQVAAAAVTGMRFTACRGSVDRSHRHGALPPDSIAQEMDEILTDCERVASRFHDPSPTSKLRVAFAPHSLHAASTELMKATAELAVAHNVRLHTHIAADTTDDEVAAERFGCTPIEWLESVGWLTDRTWVAHCVFPSASEIARLGAARVGVAHCATACLLMGVGIGPMVDLRGAGSPVGLGVDGSSNSDSSSMWMEARMALLAQRFRGGPAAMDARGVLEMATVGGAGCLGRQGEIGVLAPGACADLAVWPLDDLAHAGAVSDPVEAWLRCGPSAPRHVLVGGQAIVTDGSLVATGIEELLRDHRRIARRIQGC